MDKIIEFMFVFILSCCGIGAIMMCVSFSIFLLKECGVI